MPDQELLAKYRAGDVRAFEELVQKYKNPLYSYILRTVYTRDEADDVFQEVWLRAIRNIDRCDGRKFLSWLFRIAHNLIIDRYRKSRPVVSLDEKKDGAPALVDNLPDKGEAPFRRMIDGETGATIDRALALLPVEQKEVFLMRVQADIPFKEIARIQRVSINTALARMQYALAKLRIAIAEDMASTGGGAK